VQQQLQVVSSQSHLRLVLKVLGKEEEGGRERKGALDGMVVFAAYCWHLVEVRNRGGRLRAGSRAVEGRRRGEREAEGWSEGV
jgi:hypothetical protein